MLQMIEDDADPAAPPLPRDVVGLLCESLSPIEPPGERACILAERVAEVAQPATDASGLTTRHREECGWVPMLPGIRGRLLQSDGVAQSWLVQLEPGARAPAHDHPDLEECVVLEGEVEYIGGARLRAGDYQVARPGAHHTELYSASGALVFLRYARPVENYVRLSGGAVS